MHPHALSVPDKPHRRGTAVCGHRGRATVDSYASGRGATRYVQLVTHRRKQHDFADRAPSRQHHHETVDPDPDPARRRHPVLERLDERLVVGLGLLVAGAGQRALLLEPPALLVGVVQLGERVGDLQAADERLEALDEALGATGGAWRTARARPGSRAGTSAGSGSARRALRAARRRAAARCPARRRAVPGPPSRPPARRAHGRLEDVDAGPRADRLDQPLSAPRRREVELASVADLRRPRTRPGARSARRSSRSRRTPRTTRAS